MSTDTPAPDQLPQAVWLEQCASHFMTHGGLGRVDAMQAAQNCLDLGGGSKEPAVAAREDMATWEE